MQGKNKADFKFYGFINDGFHLFFYIFSFV